MTDESTPRTDPTTNSVRDIVDLATRAAGPFEVEGGKHYILTGPNTDEPFHLDLDLDEYRSHPHRPKGTTIVGTTDSFIAYCLRHENDDTEVFASLPDASGNPLRVVAVFDSHQANAYGGNAGWCEHRLELRLNPSAEWAAWAGKNKKWCSQIDFAEFIEDHLPQIVNPAPADLLEVAQSLEGKTSVEFGSSERLSNGQRRLAWKETIDARAGVKGQLDVPERFDLALRAFAGGDTFKVSARFRWRINGGVLTVQYALDNVSAILEEAYNDILSTIESGIESPVFSGLPPTRD